jgi:hypothetical protein
MSAVLSEIVATVELYPHDAQPTASGSDGVLYRFINDPHWVRCMADHYSIESWYVRVELGLPRYLTEKDTADVVAKIHCATSEYDTKLYEAIKDTKNRARLLWLIRQRTRTCGSGVGKLPTEICMYVHAIVNQLTMANVIYRRPVAVATTRV